jgi:uncharacterized protein YxeA
MKKTTLLLISIFSMALGATINHIWQKTYDKSDYFLNPKGDRVEIFHGQGNKICMIEPDIKGFNEMTIFNKSGAVAHIRWMVEGPPSIMDAYLKVVSKKNGSDEVQVLNPDYADD